MKKKAHRAGKDYWWRSPRNIKRYCSIIRSFVVLNPEFLAHCLRTGPEDFVPLLGLPLDSVPQSLRDNLTPRRKEDDLAPVDSAVQLAQKICQLETRIECR